MILLRKKIFYLLPLLWLLSCGDDDSVPTTAELIRANAWIVNNYGVQASSGGVSVPQDVLAPFVDDVLAEAPLNGIITFDVETFTIDDQGTIIDGTWSLSPDENEITMTFTLGAQTFTFQILQINSDNFNLAYTAVENISVVGSPVAVTLEITAFLIPA